MFDALYIARPPKDGDFEYPSNVNSSLKVSFRSHIIDSVSMSCGNVKSHDGVGVSVGEGVGVYDVVRVGVGVGGSKLHSSVTTTG